MDSAILDIESKFFNNTNDDYQVEVSYWIDILSVSIEESIDLGLEELKTLGFEPIKILVNNKEWNN